MKKLINLLLRFLYVVFYPVIISFNLLIFGIFSLVVIIGSSLMTEEPVSNQKDD